MRLVVDFSFVYRFVYKERFKLEDLRTALPYLEQGEAIIKFHLSSGYHHLDIHPDSQQRRRLWIERGGNWSLELVVNLKKSQWYLVHQLEWL